MHTKVAAELGLEFPIFAFSHCRDVVAEVFAYIAALKQAGGTIFLVDQNARAALAVADPYTMPEVWAEAMVGLGRAWRAMPGTGPRAAPSSTMTATGGWICWCFWATARCGFIRTPEVPPRLTIAVTSPRICWARPCRMPRA